MHLLVVANETVTGRTLIEAVERHRAEDLRVTVICPVNQPRRGYVVYEDTRLRTDWSSRATRSRPCATRSRSWSRRSTS